MGITRWDLHKKRATGGKRHIHRKKRKFELGRPPAATKLVHGERRVRRVRTRGGNRKWRALRLSGGIFSWGSENTAKHCRILDVVYNATNNELVRTKTLVKGCIVQIDGTPFRNWYYKWYGIRLCNPKEVEKERRKQAGIAAKKKQSRKKVDEEEEEVKKVSKKDKKGSKGKEAKKSAKKDEEEEKPSKKEKKGKADKKADDKKDSSKKKEKAETAEKKTAEKKEGEKKKGKRVYKNHLRKTHLRRKQKGFGLEEGLQAQLAVPVCKILARISSRPGQDGRANGYILEGKELEFYQKKLDKKKHKK